MEPPGRLGREGARAGVTRAGVTRSRVTRPPAASPHPTSPWRLHLGLTPARFEAPDAPRLHCPSHFSISTSTDSQHWRWCCCQGRDAHTTHATPGCLPAAPPCCHGAFSGEVHALQLTQWQGPISYLPISSHRIGLYFPIFPSLPLTQEQPGSVPIGDPTSGRPCSSAPSPCTHTQPRPPFGGR